jgi:hypothetical protein
MQWYNFYFICCKYCNQHLILHGSLLSLRGIDIVDQFKHKKVYIPHDVAFVTTISYISYHLPYAPISETM